MWLLGTELSFDPEFVLHELNRMEFYPNKIYNSHRQIHRPACSVQTQRGPQMGCPYLPLAWVGACLVTRKLSSLLGGRLLVLHTCNMEETPIFPPYLRQESPQASFSSDACPLLGSAPLEIQLPSDRCGTLTVYFMIVTPFSAANSAVTATINHMLKPGE